MSKGYGYKEKRSFYKRNNGAHCHVRKRVKVGCRTGLGSTVNLTIEYTDYLMEKDLLRGELLLLRELSGL